MCSDSEDLDHILEWDMEDDIEFTLRPGFKFPLPLTYMEMCQHVNKRVQLVGSDPVRAHVRRHAAIEGNSVPCRVTFSCCHGRQHRKREKTPKNPDAPRAVRTQEARTFLFSQCQCYFSVILQPSDLHGTHDEEEDDEEYEDEVQEVQTHRTQDEKKGGDNYKKYLWMIPEKQKFGSQVCTTEKKQRSNTFTI
jgi:hypothetical protein